MDTKHHQHFLLISLASQGHLNPTFQLAKRLISIGGTRATFVTTVHGLAQIKSFPSIEGLSYASFSDGFDDGIKSNNDSHHIMSEIKRVGSQSLTALIKKLSEEHCPVTFIIYTILVPWAAEVAHNFGIPSAFLSIMSTTAFAICHHYFNYYVNNNNSTPFPSGLTIEGLPPFGTTDVPSYLIPTSPHVWILPTFQEHFQILQKDPNSCVLLNTFDGLEEPAIKAIRNLNPITIGPLVPTVFWEENNQPNAQLCCDLFAKSGDNYLQWLDSKPDCSVVYISFGTFVVLKKNQIEEILHGLVDSGLPFLWTIRFPENDEGEEAQNMMKNTIKKEQGLVVPWCSQVEVLRHKSVGCFVTHCGWNSTVESFAAGVPMVACPHFADQTTNAKLVEEVWGTGVRAQMNEEVVVAGEEIKRCVEIVIGDGERGEKIRRNAQKWKDLAKEAVMEGGSSDYNLRQFIGRLG